MQLAEQRIAALNAEIRAPAAISRAATGSSCSIGRAAGTHASRLLDGPRAQARQAGGPERAAARRRGPARRRLCARRRRHARAWRDVRYVITLDTDTQLPRDAARQLVGADGAPAEPAALRRGDSAGVVAEGYGILQPRVGRQPARRRIARAMRGCSAASRASTPTRAPSPTSTRTCSAKARSSARASTTSTPSSGRCAGRFPENRILSHDLIEGCYARSGLLSDVELLEDFPAALQPGREPPPAPLDPRRLAAARLAAPARARPARRAAAQSAVGAVALEDARQPAPQPGPGGPDCCCCCWAGRCGSPGFWTPGGGRHPAAAGAVRHAARSAVASRTRFCGGSI